MLTCCFHSRHLGYDGLVLFERLHISPVSPSTSRLTMSYFDVTLHLDTPPTRSSSGRVPLIRPAHVTSTYPSTRKYRHPLFFVSVFHPPHRVRSPHDYIRSWITRSFDDSFHARLPGYFPYISWFSHMYLSFPPGHQRSRLLAASIVRDSDPCRQTRTVPTPQRHGSTGGYTFQTPSPQRSTGDCLCTSPHPKSREESPWPSDRVQALTGSHTEPTTP